MNAFKDYWQGLSQREQQLLGGMGLVIFVAIIYWGMWQPLNQAKLDSQKKLSQQMELNTWAEQTIAKIKSAGVGKKPTNSGSLSQIVNRTKSFYSFKIARMQPKGTNLQLWIDEAIFSELIAWIAVLENQHQITVSQLDVTKADASGRVKVRRLELSK